MAHHGDWQRSDDTALLRAIVARDDAAFAAFYRRHLSRVLAYLLRETSDRETTADLAAEVFAAVMLAAATYRSESDTAAPWVIGIARNTLGTSRRRGRVEDRARRRLGYQPVALEDPDLSELACSEMVVRKRVSRGLTRLRAQLEKER
jgi:DNA-directed RNA polymerase specialized sigma24 family protein